MMRTCQTLLQPYRFYFFANPRQHGNTPVYNLLFYTTELQKTGMELELNLAD
jgi:hypothetical protein